MTKFLSGLLVIFCIINGKSQLNVFLNFETPSLVYNHFSGYYTLQNGINYTCSGNSLAFDEFGYGSMIAYPETITFQTNENDIFQYGKKVNISFKYRYWNPNHHKMRVVVRYENPCNINTYSGTLQEILINNTQFTGTECLSFNATIPEAVLSFTTCPLKIYLDLYSTSTTGTSTIFIIDDFLVTQNPILGTQENYKIENITYPNPFEKFINIANADKIQKLTITDFVGNIIFEVMNPAEIINTELIKPGVYFLTVLNKNGTISTNKIIKK